MKLFLGLGLLAAFLCFASYAAAGAEFKEPMVAVCYDKAPARWQEAVHAEVEVTSLPLRIRCEMVDRRSGETISWDSGRAACPHNDDFLSVEGSNVRTVGEPSATRSAP